MTMSRGWCGKMLWIAFRYKKIMQDLRGSEMLRQIAGQYTHTELPLQHPEAASSNILIVYM